MVDSGDSGGRRSSVSARPAPLLPPPPLRCGSPAADPALRRPLAGSARPSGGRARASPHRLVHHPRPARVALPARAASTSCSTAVAPRRRWRGSSPFSKAELVSSAQIGAPEASARAGFTATPRASGDPPATHSAPPSRPSAPLSSLREPRLPVQQSDPKGQAPFSTPSAAASRRLVKAFNVFPPKRTTAIKGVERSRFYCLHNKICLELDHLALSLLVASQFKMLASLNSQHPLRSAQSHKPLMNLEVYRSLL